MGIPTYSRREFFVQSTQMMSLAAVATALTGCGGSPSSPGGVSGLPALPTLSATIISNTFTLTIDGGSPLAAVGSAALVTASGRSFLVAHTGQSAFTTLTATCTHQQCTVSTYQNQVYECPCHGSQYSTTGAVVRGPAPTALRQFPATFANGVLTITTA